MLALVAGKSAFGWEWSGVNIDIDRASRETIKVAKLETRLRELLIWPSLIALSTNEWAVSLPKPDSTFNLGSSP